VISGFRRDIDETVIFWDITQRRVVIVYRRFGTTYRSHLIGLLDPQNYNDTMRNIPKARRCQAENVMESEPTTSVIVSPKIILGIPCVSYGAVYKCTYEGTDG
jgi:hypothetical protein